MTLGLSSAPGTSISVSETVWAYIHLSLSVEAGGAGSWHWAFSPSPTVGWEPNEVLSVTCTCNYDLGRGSSPSLPLISETFLVLNWKCWMLTGLDWGFQNKVIMTAHSLHSPPHTRPQMSIKRVIRPHDAPVSRRVSLLPWAFKVESRNDCFSRAKGKVSVNHLIIWTGHTETIGFAESQDLRDNPETK